MERSGDLGHLKTKDWEQLQDWADRFEEAWRQGGPVDLNRFLPSPGDPLRSVVLQEHIKIDLEFRGRGGHPVSLRIYLEQFTELGTAATLSPRLIYEEYRVRHLYGDKPGLSVYQAGYPAQFAELERLIKEQPIEVVTRDNLVATAPLPAQDTPPPTPKAEPTPPPPPKEEKSKKGKGKSKQQLLKLSGDYKLIKRIGSGGFGEVWRAEAPGGAEAAIKIVFRPMDHEEAQRELHASELIKRLRHPFLLQTHNFQPHQDRLYIIMELADGSLRDRLKECRKEGLSGIPLIELLTYFREAAEALDFLHDQHVLHRDIKPENILILQRHTKLADFGLAKLHERQQLVSATGSGTPLYMAPEVWKGKVSARSDQYSLALTYAELRLDRRVFTSSDMMQIMFDHLERVPDLSPLAEEEQKVLLKALSKDPDQRYNTCKEFVRALEKAVIPTDRHADTFLEEPGPSGQTSAPRRRREALDGMSTLARSGDTGPAATVDRSDQRTDVLPDGTRGPSPNWRGSATKPWTEERQKTGLWPILAAGAVVVGLGLGWIYWPVTTAPIPPTPPTSKVVLPPGCTAVAGATPRTIDGKEYYEQLVVEKAGQTFKFRLIPHDSENDPPTFYMLETKVSVAQFLAAVRDSAFQDRLGEYQGRPNWPVKRLWEKQGAFPQDGQLPVTQITVVEAHNFAQWLGGYLPTVKQWNKAAGYYEKDRSLGPFKQPADKNAKPDVAVGRQKPLPVGQAKDDESVFGCRDMAGNGQEWTRDVQGNDQERSVPVSRPGPADSVIVRGQSFSEPRPFHFDDPVGSEPYLPKTLADDLSFRVVLEPL